MSANPVNLTSPFLTGNLAALSPASRFRTAGCILCADAMVLTFVFAAAGLGRHLVTPTYQAVSYLDLLLSVIMILYGFWLQGLYPGILIHAAEEMRRIFFSVTIVFLLMSCSAFLWRNFDSYSRAVFLISWAAAAPLVLLGRQLVRAACKARPWWGASAIILGSSPAAERVARTLQDPRWGIRIAGILTDHSSSFAWAGDLPPIVGSLQAAPALAAASRVSQYAILAMPQKSSEEIRDIIRSCCQGFQNILIVPDMPGLFSLGIVTRQMGSEIGFEVPQRLFQRGPAVIKRVIDGVLSLAAILLLLPVFLLLALCVRLGSRGSILYGQDRYGRSGIQFKAWKFRTMVPNAEQILHHHLAAHPEDLFEWQRCHKLKHDPRVTFIGKWMRRLSLDELPQLFNVLAGQMSLVGPRPIVKLEIEKYGASYTLYSRVRPGITGLWQVSGRNNTTYEERVNLDQFYVSNWSIWLDLYILVRTFRTVATAEGAY